MTDLQRHYLDTFAALRTDLSHGAPMTQEQRHAAYEMAGALAEVIRTDPDLAARLELVASAARRGA